MKINGMVFDFNAIVVGYVKLINKEAREIIEEIGEMNAAAGSGEKIIDDLVRPDINQVFYTTLAKALPTFIRDTYEMCEYETTHNKDYFKMLDSKIAAAIQENELEEDVEEYLGDQLNQWKSSLEAGKETLRVIRVGDEDCEDEFGDDEI